MEYFISDTHFGHQNILKFERNKFKTIEEHDSVILNNLKTLKSTDTLYHLGDFAFNLSQKIKKEWADLKCQKILIFGNHDKIERTLTGLFDKTYNHPIFLTRRIVLSHYPIPVNNGVLNIHGHLHNGEYLGVLTAPNYFNANVYLNKLQPIDLNFVNHLVNKLPKDNTKFKQEWYSTHTINIPSEVHNIPKVELSYFLKHSKFTSSILRNLQSFLIENWYDKENLKISVQQINNELKSYLRQKSLPYNEILSGMEIIKYLDYIIEVLST